MTNQYSTTAYPQLNRKERKKLEIAHFKQWTNDKLKLIKLADIYNNLNGFGSLSKDFAKIYIAEKLQIIDCLKIDNSLYGKTKLLAEQINKTLN